MTQFITKTVTTLGLLVLTAFASTASADTYHHIDGLAQRIENRSRQLLSETRHYRHTSEYRHLVSDGQEMIRLADHIHDLAHHHGSLGHLRSDLAELDSKFHHLESVFDRIEHNAAYGHGHVHGNTAHVQQLLALIEDDLHHLQDDIRSLTRSHDYVAPPVVVRRPAVVTRPTGFGHGTDRWSGYGHRPSSSGFGHSYSRSREISIGGGSSRMTFRF